MHNPVISLNDIFLCTYHHKYYLETPILDNKDTYLQFAQTVFFCIHIVKTPPGVRRPSSSSASPPPQPPLASSSASSPYPLRSPQIGLVIFEHSCSQIVVPSDTSTVPLVMTVHQLTTYPNATPL